MAKERRTKDPSKRQTSNGKKNSTDKKKYDGVQPVYHFALAQNHDWAPKVRAFGVIPSHELN